MSETAPRRPSIHDMDEREAQKREQLADLALIAPTPDIVRQVVELEVGSEPEVGHVEGAPQPAPVEPAPQARP